MPSKFFGVILRRSSWQLLYNIDGLTITAHHKPKSYFLDFKVVYANVEAFLKLCSQHYGFRQLHVGIWERCLRGVGAGILGNAYGMV